MNTKTIERAFEMLGCRLSYPLEVELLLVGGAAGMLTGLLPPSRTTLDCDIMHAQPDSAVFVIERHAAEVATTLGLPTNWLNSDAKIRADTLPDGWRTRRVWIGTWGQLRVFAVSRIDLIAMKVLAGRAQDIEDVRMMKPRTDDIAFVNQYLKTMSARGAASGDIADATTLIDSLELHDT